MESRLGRGLGSLLPETPNREAATSIDLKQIRPNPFQPRKVFDPAALEELRDSIQNHGILQPVLVRPAGTGTGFELVSGERRWRAARLAGLSAIPAIVREGLGDDQMLELALVENVQRQDLDPIERARGFKGMMKALGLTQEGVAAKVGLRRSSVANHLRLLDLPEPVREAIAKGVFSMGHAKVLLGLSRPEDQVQLMKEVVRGELSVRETERRVRERLEPTREIRPQPAPAEPAPWAREAEARMREFLGTQVRLTSDARGERGTLSIEFHQRSELDRLLALLAPRTQV